MGMKNLKIKHIGLKGSLFHDVYYRVLKTSWTNFILLAGFYYLLINFLFALIYWLSPAEILNINSESLWDAFLFSFQTSSTLGYGFFLPQSTAAHVIVIFDTMVGIFYVAIMTGLAFSKFARPSAKILFSDKIILSTFDHIPTLMFRIGNSRDTHIIDASLNVAILLPYTSKEGHVMKRFYKLPLMSNNNPTFSLSWTAMHQIDENSPLKGFSLERLNEMRAIVFVSLTGIDDILSQAIHANYRYTINDIIEAKKFSDILTTDEDNNYTVNFLKFHDVE